MRVDLVIRADTKLAIEQWLERRGLGTLTQDTDPESPTFGDYIYSHNAAADQYFMYWRHPSGKLEATRDASDPENPVVTYFSGFYGILTFPDKDTFELALADWLRNNTAVSVLESFNGIGGEGVTVLDHSDLTAHLENIGVPGHEILGESIFSNPTFWWASPVMLGDQREWPEGSGTLWESQIDFNVWTPEQYPAGWQEIVPDEPDPPATSEWAPGVAYAVGDEVTYQGATYRCLQAHTSLVGWNPAAVPALWQIA